MSARPREFDATMADFLGMDTYTDKTLLPPRYLSRAENRILLGGALETRKGHRTWGGLMLPLPGARYSWIDVPVGDETYILVHQGARIYVGKKSDTGMAVVLGGLDANPLVVSDDASEFARAGETVGSAAAAVVKLLFRQASGCRALEFDGTAWVGRAAGINVDSVTFSAASTTSSANLPLGTYRLRVVALRQVNDVRVSESAPAGPFDTLFHREVVIAAGGKAILATISHPGADAQITHYMVQATKVLSLLGGTEFSDNGNDPSAYYETPPIPAGDIGAPIEIDMGDLRLQVPDLVGFKPIPGHLVSVTQGDNLFFSPLYSVDHPFSSRVYASGGSGYFYHNELYDALTSYNCGDGDGQEIEGLALCAGLLVVLKASRTGTLNFRSGAPQVIWRDNTLGIKHRKAAAALSEDLLVTLNQDGVVRIFDGVGYSSSRTFGKDKVDFSEKVRAETQNIDPATVEFIFHEDRLHLLYTLGEGRQALVFHRKEGGGWTLWSALSHNLNLLTGGGMTWIFLRDGFANIFEQSPLGVELYTDNGAEITTVDTFAAVRAKDRKSILEMWRCTVEGIFTEGFLSNFVTNNGFVATAEAVSTPNPGTGIEFYDVMPQDDPVIGNSIEQTLTGLGYSRLRAVTLELVESYDALPAWTRPDGTTPGAGEPGGSSLVESSLDLDGGEEDREEGSRADFDGGEEDRDEVDILDLSPA